MLEGNTTGYQAPLKGCGCIMCETARAEQAKARPVINYNPFAASLRDLAEKLNSAPAPFEPEPQPEPVYTHVLLPYYEFGEPIIDGAEFHTAESLIEAMSKEQASGYGFKVYKLSECIFSIDPTDNSK
jgi:hypothetical protein